MLGLGPLMTKMRVQRAALILLFLAAIALLMWPGSSDLRAQLQADMQARGAYRVHYQGAASREWGTFCKLPGGGYFTVAHVSDNGTPAIGPQQAVTASNAPSDWAFVGVDPADLDPQAFPAMVPGQSVTILGYPARDRDGEEIPGKVYTADNTPPFIWVELFDETEGVTAEGVVGGISGSCVLDQDGRILASVHANGFSKIEGTTNTWALVVPIRAAITEAQGLPAAPAMRFAGIHRPAPRALDLAPQGRIAERREK